MFSGRTSSYDAKFRLDVDCKLAKKVTHKLGQLERMAICVVREYILEPKKARQLAI